MGGTEGKAAAQKPQNPGEGIRDIKTTNVFRVVNFELYAKPVSWFTHILFKRMNGDLGHDLAL